MSELSVSDLCVVEALDPAQREDVLRLLGDVARHDRHPALGESKALEVAGVVPMDGVAVLARGEGGLAGYAHVRGTERSWNVQTVVRPAARTTDLLFELTAAALAAARARAQRRIQWWTVRTGPAHDDVARRLNLASWRDLLQMRRPLPSGHHLVVPDGVHLRAFDPERDTEAWLELNRRAFARHPEQGAFGAADLEARMAEPWFDASGFLLAEDDVSGALAGFCWVKVHEDPPAGEIYVIGVDPSWRGRGLGRALVTAGMAWMGERDLPEATLYTDADNEAALSLYRGLGFAIDHTDRVYVAEP